MAVINTNSLPNFKFILNDFLFGAILEYDVAVPEITYSKE